MTQFTLQERNVEQIADVPVPQIQEQFLEVVKNIPQKRVHHCIAEQIVGMPHATDHGQLVKVIQRVLTADAMPIVALCSISWMKHARLFPEVFQGD